MAPDDHTADLLPFLGRLADTFLKLADDGPGHLVYVAPDDDGCDVGVRDLEAPPAETLLGFVAPDEWTALGVVAGGWARPLDVAHGQLAAGDGSRTRAAVVTLVHRSGLVVGRTRVGETMMTEPPAYGLTLDALQRALGLPAAPPLQTTGVLFASSWLENIADCGRSLTWAEARALHPAVQLLAQAEPPVTEVDLVEAARALERACDWEELRWLVVEGRTKERNITPAEAAWFDAGSFSRWAMSWRAGLDELLAEVKRTSGSGVSRRCASVLQRLGILDRAAA